MMNVIYLFVTTSRLNDIKRYRRANAVLRYRRSVKPATISYVATIRFGP